MAREAEMEYSDFEFLTFDCSDGIARVTFNNPANLNALSPKVVEELHKVVDQIEGDKSIEVVIFTGAGDKAFIAGADIKSMSRMHAEDALKFAHRGQSLLSRLEALPQTTIAAVNGFALGGGCEFALACDLIYATQKAKFGQPEVNLGIIPGFGGTVRLTNRVGLGRAKEMIFKGDMISAQKAMEIGLVNAVFEPGALIEEVNLIARAIQQRSPNAIAQAKMSMHFALDHDYATAMKKEADLFRVAFEHPDQKEGMEAFMGKRPPKWRRP